jgi:hypothetical protein
MQHTRLIAATALQRWALGSPGAAVQLNTPSSSSSSAGQAACLLQSRCSLQTSSGDDGTTAGSRPAPSSSNSSSSSAATQQHSQQQQKSHQRAHHEQQQAEPEWSRQEIEAARAAVFETHVGDGRRSGRRALLRPLRGRYVADWYSFTLTGPQFPMMDDDLEEE